MNSERNIERLLDNWLADGPNEVNDRVIDVVADRIGRQRQQPAWRISWRDSHVNSYVKPLLAIAAVVVIVVAGIAVLGRPSGSDVGGAPSTAPSPSPAASAAPSPATSTAPSRVPSASAVFPAWYTGDKEGAGILPAGESTTRFYKPGSTFTVPEGWVNEFDVPIAYSLFPDSKTNEAEYALSGETARGIFMVSVDSPYFFCEAWEKTQGTAAERVAFLAASDAFVVSKPVDVTIGGLTGKQVDVRLDPDRPTATCPGDPPTTDLSDQRTRVAYLDTPPGIIAIAVSSKHSADHEAFLAEAMPIVESFKFKTGQ